MRHDPIHLRSFEKEKQIVSACIKALQIDFKVASVSESRLKKMHQRLGKFASLKPYKQVFLKSALELTKDKSKFHIAIVSVNSVVEIHSKQIRREVYTEWDFVGLATLKRDYGRVYIRPETLQDKINELFNPVEVDFEEDKEFSKNYFVQTQDEQLLRRKMTPSFLSAIKKQEGLEIEIDGKALMVRLGKGTSVENVQIVATFLQDLTKEKN